MSNNFLDIPALLCPCRDQLPKIVITVYSWYLFW